VAAPDAAAAVGADPAGDAVAAAVAAAATLGVIGVEPVILADGANVIVHLTPAPLVGKVPASTPAVRPEVDAALGRELELAVFLTRAGAPVMPPSAEVPGIWPPRPPAPASTAPAS
jgi:hypothetical protein